MTSDAPSDIQEQIGAIDVADTLEDRRVRARVKERLFGGAAEPVRVDRFTVLDRLGQGAMGVVYSAFDPKLDRRVALKFLRVRAGTHGSDTARRRLVDEARAVAKLSHPNVLSVYDVGESGDRVFIAMEYVAGETLAGWMTGDRTPREVVDVFVQAGRGLMAAHAAGMVHRDFKPANVLLGKDSTGLMHVRVADFGLALSVESAAAERAGTPAYMAPEQHRGEVVDVRADQFAYCVALWEALYGERPFVDTSAPGRPEVPAGRGKGVPEYLRVACARGLSADPADRFEDMDALLTCIVTDPSERRRRWVTRGLLVGFGALVAVSSVALSTSKKEVCPTDERGLVGTWDSDRKQEIAAAFASSGLPYWKTSLRTLQGAFDKYSAQITAGRKDACEATHVRKQQSEALLDRRVACLDSRLGELRGLSDEFAQADRKAVEKAVAAAAKLSSVSACSNVDALERRMRLPSEAQKIQVDTQYRRLDKAEALRKIGRFQESQQAAASVVEEAKKIGYTPLVAKALYVRGAAEIDGGNHKNATASLEEAVAASIAGRADTTLADATTRLVFSTGYWQRDMAAARKWGQIADAALTASGRDLDTEAKLRDFESGVAAVSGKRGVAVKKARESLALLESRYGPDDVQVARGVSTLGNALYGAKKYKEAEGHFVRALVIFRATYGEQHPRVSFVLSNLGAVQSASGRNKEALATLQAALAIKEKALGEKHPSVAKTVSHIADVLAYMKRYDESMRFSKRAISLIGKRLGDDHPMLINYYVNLGLTYVELKDAAGMLSSASHAINIITKKKPEPAKDPRFMGALSLRGRAYLAQGKHAAAITDLERALAIYNAKKHYRDEIGGVRFGLARALVAAGKDVARARTLAAAALADFKTDKQHAGSAREVEAFLARRK